MMRLIFNINYYKLIDKVSKLRKTFANNLSANIKLSKTQTSKIVQPGGFIGRLLESLLKTGLPFTKYVLNHYLSVL